MYVSYIIYSRYGSIDYSEARINEVKQGDAKGYAKGIMKSSFSTVDFEVNGVIHDSDDEELFFTNNTVKWSPGPSGTWNNFKDYDQGKVLGSGDIAVISDLRLNDTIDWDVDLLFNYGDSKYSIDIEDHSSYDHKERFVTYGYGQYGGDFESWYALAFTFTCLD